jgi:YHS domain-containing protein
MDHASAHRHHDHAPEGQTPDGRVKDPVCGMSVDPHRSTRRADHGGRTYCFCSDRCRERFIADPSRFLESESAKVEPVPAGTIYTCITLIKGDLTGIVRARNLSKATMSNIRQNLFFAFIYNAAGVRVAAGVLCPLLGVLLSPVVAAAAMALSSVSVIGSALRLRTVRI